MRGARVEEMSVDGGKVRLRTPKREPGEWRDYKAVNLHQRCVSAFFQDNAKGRELGQCPTLVYPADLPR